MPINGHRDLKVWQLAMDLVVASYRLTAQFPLDERYGLSSQIKRAAVSIPANIAEGYGRETTGSYLQFLRISRGSLRELETHLMITARLSLVPTEQVTPLLERCDEIGRMLFSLIRSIQRSDTDA